MIPFGDGEDDRTAGEVLGQSAKKGYGVFAEPSSDPFVMVSGHQGQDSCLLGWHRHGGIAALVRALQADHW
jgi:hypothetical protein